MIGAGLQVQGENWVFIMREILSIGAQALILLSFVALLVFYGLVFWHWRNDTKRRDLGGENWPNPVATTKPPKQT
ncbi:MAG: hypothetical protein WBC04_02165 [Candidatus Acidiferrales bacterium]